MAHLQQATYNVAADKMQSAIDLVFSLRGFVRIENDTQLTVCATVDATKNIREGVEALNRPAGETSTSAIAADAQSPVVDGGEPPAAPESVPTPPAT